MITELHLLSYIRKGGFFQLLALYLGSSGSQITHQYIVLLMKLVETNKIIEKKQ